MKPSDSRGTGMGEGYEVLGKRRKREGKSWKKAKTEVQSPGRDIKIEENYEKVKSPTNRSFLSFILLVFDNFILPKDLILQLELLIILQTHPRIAFIYMLFPFSLMSPLPPSLCFAVIKTNTWPCFPIISGTDVILKSPLFSFHDQELPSVH